MGVKKYQSWVRDTFKQYVTNNLLKMLTHRGKTRMVNGLFLDLNAIIHAAVNQVYEGVEDSPDSYWGKVVEALVGEIIEIMDITEPQYLMYLGADGSVSKAKMLQQRQRSYKSASSEVFSRNNVKPGTEFMLTLADRLRDSLKIVMNKRKQNGEFVPGAVEFSDASIPGEGEHKIIARMKERTRLRGSEKFVDVIFSPDSDVHFLLMLNAPEGETTIIMREVHKREEGKPKYEFFDVTEIRNQLKYGVEIGHGKSKVNTMNDFALISCFAGNDFLPALPFIKYGTGSAFDAILSSYSQTFMAKKQTPDFVYDNWINLRLFLNTLAGKAENFLAGTAKQQAKFYNEETGEDRRSRALTMGTMSNKKDEPRFETSFFDVKYNQKITGTYHSANQLEIEDLDYDYIDEMCHAYLEGLVWVIEYYRSQGTNVNLNWAYTFHYAPNIQDLINYLDRHEEPTWKKLPLLTSVVEVPFTPVEQLLAVLRPEELNLLPRIAGALFLDKMPSLYPDKILTDYTLVPFGKEYEAIVLINFPDMLRIHALFEAIEDDPSVKARNKRHGVIKLWPRTQRK